MVWFGVLDGVGLLLGLGALSIVKRRAHLRGHAAVARILAVIDVLLVVGVVAFGVVGAFWAAVSRSGWSARCGACVIRSSPRGSTRGSTPRRGRPINSMGTQSDAMGQTAGGPPLGAIASAGLGAGRPRRVGAPARCPTLALYARAIRRGSVGTLAPDEIDEELDRWTRLRRCREPRLPEIPGD